MGTFMTLPRGLYYLPCVRVSLYTVSAFVKSFFIQLVSVFLKRFRHTNTCKYTVYTRLYGANVDIVASGSLQALTVYALKNINLWPETEPIDQARPGHWPPLCRMSQQQ